MFMFALYRRPSVCRLSVTFVHPTQPIEIFGNVSAPFNTLVTCRAVELGFKNLGFLGFLKT